VVGGFAASFDKTMKSCFARWECIPFGGMHPFCHKDGLCSPPSFLPAPLVILSRRRRISVHAGFESKGIKYQPAGRRCCQFVKQDREPPKAAYKNFIAAKRQSTTL